MIDCIISLEVNSARLISFKIGTFAFCGMECLEIFKVYAPFMSGPEVRQKYLDDLEALLKDISKAKVLFPIN